MKNKIKQFLEYFKPIKCSHRWNGDLKTMDEAKRLRDRGNKKIIRLLQASNSIHELYQCDKCGKWELFKWL